MSFENQDEKNYSPTSTQKQNSSNNTCLILGGIGCLVIILILVIVVALLLKGTKTIISTIVEEFTETTPMSLPTIECSNEEIDTIKQKWENFTTSLLSGQLTEPMTFTDKEINLLIQHHPDWELLKNRAHITFEQDKLYAQLSIDLEPFTTLPVFGKYLKGRYFNGKATFDIFIRNGILFLMVQSGEVKGHQLPPEAITELRQKNIAENIRDNPKFAALLERIERLEISNSLLIVIPKKSPEQQTEGASQNTATISPYPYKKTFNGFVSMYES